MPRLRVNSYSADNFWCKLFGHTWTGGWYGDLPYFKIEQRGTDGLGRVHANLYFECDRCNKKVMSGHIHLTDNTISHLYAEINSLKDDEDA